MQLGRPARPCSRAPCGSNTTSTGGVIAETDANATTVTDQAGKERRSITNALGQLIRVDEPTGSGLGTVSSPNQATSYTYDTLNNLTTVTQGSQTRTFTYNSLSRLLSAMNPESGTISYGYDPNGNLTTKTDARSISTTYTYDALNRVTFRNYSDSTPDVTYTYDDKTNAVGKLTKVSSSVSATEYTAFDILGRVTAHKQTTDSVDYMTGYTYNLSGALIEETYPSGRVVKNTLDTDGSLSQVQSKRSSDTFRNFANAFNYTAAGAVSSMRLGNGLWETTQFNSRLQPTQIGLGKGSTTQSLLKLDYSYGTTANNGNVLSQTITVPGLAHPFVQTYSYDELNRISNAEETSNSTQTWEQTFTYDRYGNRNFNEAETTTLPKNCGTSPNFTVCTADKKIVNPSVNTANNRLSTSDDYAFDSSGNTTGDAEGRTFVYDAENKQISVSDSNGTIGEYSYDGDGKRIKKIVPSTGETTIFAYDAAGKLIGEYATILQTGSNANTVYTTNDHLGSPRINTDATGQVISRHDYHPFGEEIATTQRTTALGYSADTIRKQFTGYEKDDETGLDFAKARTYSSSLGRFTRPDPLGTSESPNQRITFSADTGGDCELDGILTPCSIVTRGMGMGAVQAQALYHSEQRGFRSETYDLGDPLPGGHFMSIWIPDALGDAQGSGPTIGEEGTEFNNWTSIGGQQGQWFTFGVQGLPSCVINLIQGDFANVNVHGKLFNPVTDAKFTEGVPRSIKFVVEVAKLLGYQTVNDIGAITVGQDIYYAPGFFNLSTPTWAEFEGMVEEVAHFEQFLNSWSNLPLVNDIQEIGNRGQTKNFTRPPNYAEAVVSWGVNYYNAYKNTPAGKDPYADNSIEAPAKQKAASITSRVKQHLPNRNGPC